MGDKQLKIGDELLVSARIAPPANGGNFDEFDYARYLMRHGISGTGDVASGKWRYGHHISGILRCFVRKR